MGCRWVVALSVLASACASGMKPGEVDDAGMIDSGPDPVCTSDAECDDGVVCTVDSCVSGECVRTPDDTLCEATEMCELEAGCVLRPPCETDAECDDGNFCNGEETCDPATGCQAGTAPACDDGLGCTDDDCDPTDGCQHVANDGLCSNGIVCDGDEVCDPEDALADANGCVPGTVLDCDDGIPCTIDTCSEGAGGCEQMPDDAICADGVFCNGDEVCDIASGCGPGTAPDCDDGIACTSDSCDGTLDACVQTTNDSVCDDGLVCNGSEVCSAGTGCGPGTAIDCSDGLACTTDRCIEPTGMCEQLGSDADMDGFEALGCGTGDDCNDLVPAINPGATEICDGVDNDCSGGADDAAGMQCVLGSAPSACTTACGTSGTRPCNSACRFGACTAATETCNGCDDDGNGLPDDGLGCVQGSVSNCVTTCGTAGTQSCMANCSGFGTCRAATETCNDCDDDGDGSFDEGFTCRRGVTQGCTTACGSPGSRTCALDCGSFGTCLGAEVCNGCDDDGDGTADEGFTCRQGQIVACTTACGTAGTRACNMTCSAFGSCNAATETCGNGCDDDGDGMVDEGCGAPNDVCTGATVLSGTSGTTTDTYSNASRSVTDCGSGGELWYQLTVPTRSILYVDSLGSSFDTNISLRTGCGAAAVQCEDDDCAVLQEQLVRVVAPGTYYVALHAFSAATTSGTIALRWQMVPAGNGTYTRITGNGTYSGTTSGSGTLTSTCGGSGPEDGWYFTMCPSTTRTVTANTCSGTSFDSVLSIKGLSQIACNDDSCGLQSSTSGSVSGPGVFVVQVDGFGSSSGPYQVAIGGL